jgi:hypothetical protein
MPDNGHGDQSGEHSLEAGKREAADPLDVLIARVRETLSEISQLQAATMQKVAGVLAGVIGGQAEEIARLETRVKRLEKTTILLIQRKPPKWTGPGDDEEGLE